jgi:hypothetical protein
MAKETVINFNLKGLDKLQTQISDTYRARVGILGSDAARSDDSGIDNATLGVIQMFGSITKKIPPRDFLMMPVQTHSREIVRAMGSASVKAAIVAGDFKKVYSLLGAKALEYVLMAFETGGFGQWAPNAPSTIKQKGSDRPLIDTSQLRRAQTNDVVNKSDIK